MILMTGCASSSPPADIQRSLVAKMVKSPPVLDGKLDDPAWPDAEVTERFGAPFPPGNAEMAGRSDYATDVRVLWDKDHIYVGFKCLAPTIFATMTNRDDNLYEQDVTEVFLDVGTDNTHFAELQASPNAVLMDCYHTWNPAPTYAADKIDWNKNAGHVIDKDWNLTGFAAATAPIMVDGAQVGWTTEMAIPLADLLQRRGLSTQLTRGQCIRANFLRYIWLEGPDAGKRVHHQLNWSPVMQGCPHISPMAMRTILLWD